MSSLSATTSSALRDDALRELVNVGAGRALSALSRLVNDMVVTMEPVQRGLKPLTQDAEAEVLVRLTLESLPARFLLVFDQDSAAAWATRMLGGGNNPSWGALEQSALLELGNIMSCAFMDALATMTRLRLVPGLPSIHQADAHDFWDHENLGLRNIEAVWTRFFLRDANLSGKLVLLCAAPAQEALVRAVLGG